MKKKEKKIKQKNIHRNEIILSIILSILIIAYIVFIIYAMNG